MTDHRTHREHGHTRKMAIEHAEALLSYITAGEYDPETPGRMVSSLLEMTKGVLDLPSEIMRKRFPVDHHGIVVLRGIRFASLCEHHVLPFVGRASVAYIPNSSGDGAGDVVGLSKLARLVECFAQRLQTQERLTDEIASAMIEQLSPDGVAVLVEAQHECMGCRGVRQPDAVMVTSAMLGVFETSAAARSEVMELFRG